VNLGVIILFDRIHEKLIYDFRIGYKFIDHKIGIWFIFMLEKCCESRIIWYFALLNCIKLCENFI